jgi:hypothetical protein
MPIISDQGKMASGLVFEFPQKRCCNCGRTDSLQTINQDTRLTRYFFGGGSELTFNLPLPFCPACRITAKRRPSSFFKKVLVFLVTFGVLVLALTLIAEFVFPNRLLPDHIIYLSLGVSVAFTFMLYFIRKPTGQQTSYYQPVRISRLKQEFVSGTIKKITLYFTNNAYARDFTALNQEPIKDNLVEVKTA